MPICARNCRARWRGALQHVLAVDLDDAGIRRDQAEDAFDQHRLAGAGAADHHHAGAGHDVEIDAVQHLLVAERFFQAADADFRLGHLTNNTWVRT